MNTSPILRYRSEQCAKRLDHQLHVELLQLDDAQRTKLANLAILNGYNGHNQQVLFQTLAQVYFEYDLASLSATSLDSSSAIALLERWTAQRLHCAAW